MLNSVALYPQGLNFVFCSCLSGFSLDASRRSSSESQGQPSVAQASRTGRKPSSDGCISIASYRRTSVDEVKKHSIDVLPVEGNDHTKPTRKMSLSKSNSSLPIVYEPEPASPSLPLNNAPEEIVIPNVVIPVASTSAGLTRTLSNRRSSLGGGLHANHLQLPPLSPVPESPASLAATLTGQSEILTSDTETLGTHGANLTCCMGIALRQLWLDSISHKFVGKPKLSDVSTIQSEEQLAVGRAQHTPQFDSASYSSMTPLNINSNSVPSAESEMPNCIGLSGMTQSFVQTPSNDSLGSMQLVDSPRAVSPERPASIGSIQSGFVHSDIPCKVSAVETDGNNSSRASLGLASSIQQKISVPDLPTMGLAVCCYSSS